MLHWSNRTAALLYAPSWLTDAVQVFMLLGRFSGLCDTFNRGEVS